MCPSITALSSPLSSLPFLVIAAPFIVEMLIITSTMSIESFPAPIHVPALHSPGLTPERLQAYFNTLNPRIHPNSHIDIAQHDTALIQLVRSKASLEVIVFSSGPPRTPFASRMKLPRLLPSRHFCHKDLPAAGRCFARSPGSHPFATSSYTISSRKQGVHTPSEWTSSSSSLCQTAFQRFW